MALVGRSPMLLMHACMHACSRGACGHMLHMHGGTWCKEDHLSAVAACMQRWACGYMLHMHGTGCIDLTLQERGEGQPEDAWKLGGANADSWIRHVHMYRKRTQCLHFEGMVASLSGYCASVLAADSDVENARGRAFIHVADHSRSSCCHCVPLWPPWGMPGPGMCKWVVKTSLAAPLVPAVVPGGRQTGVCSGALPNCVEL
eukprot:363847-Chlamydomonas_euryale.AAC.7